MTSWPPIDDGNRVTPDPGYRLCDECEGRRVCQVCGGAGSYNGHRCSNCIGKRACPVCHGAGQVRDQRAPSRSPSGPTLESFRGAIPRKGKTP